MKAKLLVVSLSLIIVAACSKDKFESKPTLTFESINGSSFQTSQRINFKLRLTDKEGDFETDSSNYMVQRLFAKQISLVCPPDPADTIPFDYEIPAFQTSKYLDVFLDINFSYQNGDDPYPAITRCRNDDDSLYYKFWIKDAAGHVSDTVSTPAFKLIK